MVVPQWKSSGIDIARAHTFGVCISIDFVKKKKLQRSIVSSPHSNLKVDCERLLMVHWRKRKNMPPVGKETAHVAIWHLRGRVTLSALAVFFSFFLPNRLTAF